jgi:hypothetical protein
VLGDLHPRIPLSFRVRRLLPRATSAGGRSADAGIVVSVEQTRSDLSM